MKRQDLAALLLLAGWLGALLAYRAAYVEPREWAAACVAASPPLACLPRAGLLWMQQYGVWGGGALALGLAAFLGAPVAALAVAAGIGGVVNYNASFGMLGLALGAWAWISARPAGPSAKA
ncbi:MAG: hypothetical protein BGP12_21315 [Rhodospirillales bacterium 70-18]|nr:hypothetical protein [Rhodospirillales bacterium]OJY70293.1 MAG: hypothetical protein BGP12_21315 [Rhodospirillales bacterium 70-18]